MEKRKTKYATPKLSKFGKLKDITNKIEMPGDGGSLAYS